jgi:hypothetical protein
LLLLPLALLPDPAWAGGFHVTVIGVRRTAMLTNLADPDDGTAIFVNPAGLADQPGLRLQLASGVSIFNTDLRLQALDGARYPEINAGCGDPHTDPSCPWPIDSEGYYRSHIQPRSVVGVIPFLSASHDLGFLDRSLSEVVVAAAVYAPGAYGAVLPHDAPTAYSVEEGLFVIGAASLGVGWRISPSLAIGASGSYNYRRLGYKQKLSLVDELTPAGQPAGSSLIAGLAQEALGDLELQFDGVDHGGGFGGGALFTPLPELTFGASFALFTTAAFTGPLTLRGLGSKDAGTAPTTPAELKKIIQDFGYQLPPSLRVEMPIPPAVMGGVSWWPSPELEFGLDLRVWLYELYTKQAIIPLYDAQATGMQPFTADRLSREKKDTNSFELSAGVRWLPSPDLDLMAGVSFDHSPVTDATFSLDSPSSDVFTIATGLRYHLGDNVVVGASYQFLAFFARNITNNQNSPPVNGQVSASTHIPTLEVALRL